MKRQTSIFVNIVFENSGKLFQSPQTLRNAHIDFRIRSKKLFSAKLGDSSLSESACVNITSHSEQTLSSSEVGLTECFHQLLPCSYHLNFQNNN